MICNDLPIMLRTEFNVVWKMSYQGYWKEQHSQVYSLTNHIKIFGLRENE